MILGDNTYYVSSNTNDDCPQPCHPLSHYITNTSTATYFTSNATFIFMEGEHLLDSKGLVQVVINNVDNLTLRGERGHSNTDIIIRCSSNTRGLIFNNSMIITIYDVSITGCGQDGIPPLLLTNITSLYIHHIMLYNNMYNGIRTPFGGILYIHCVTNIAITDSTFTNNNIVGNGDGLYISGYTDHITITNSAFTNNTVGGYGGGLRIYMLYSCGTDITVTNSVFTNNTVGGYGGGLHIYMLYGYDADLTVTNSTFTNNTVDGYGGGLHIYMVEDYDTDITVTNSTFTNNTVGGHGGGLRIYMSRSEDFANNNSTSTVTNSAFTNNTVGGDGGGLYIECDVTDITVTNSTFTNNSVGRDGGGLYIYGNAVYGAEGGPDITVTNSAFTNNTVGRDGGGLYLYNNGYDFKFNVTVIINSAFTNNTVGGHGGGLCIDGDGTDINVNNSAFTNNTVGGYGGGLYIDSNINKYMYIITSIFADNNGSGILAHSHVTVLFIEGHSVVANNSSPTDGGGIYLGEDCYFATSAGGHISFINNTAPRYGGAIYSHDNNDYSLLHSNLYIDYGTYYHYYLEYSRIHIYHQCTIHNLYLSADFTNNSAAIAGDQLYGGVFIFCNSHANLYEEYHSFRNIYEDHLDVIMLNNDCLYVPDTIKNVTSAHPLSPISSDPLFLCPCVNGAINCTVRSLDREVYPHQMLHVPLVTVGLCGGVSPGAIIVEYGKHINLISSATTDYTSTSCTTLNYTVKLIEYISNTIITFNVGTSDNYNINNNQPVYVNLTILPCPLGLVVNFASGDCVCSNDINHISGLFCNISWMPHPIQRSGNNWISHQDNCTIAYTGCPFDYCNTLPVKINLNQSDLQCNYNRSGILCGQCQPGLSLMLGSNQCSDCTNTSTYITISLAILMMLAGIALLLLIKLFNLTISDGSINGLLFYAYIVKLNESVYFPQGSVPVISQFIAWINLDLGFEYCFINGLDGYWKMWLQFVFPLYLWSFVIVIIVACRYSGKVSRLWSRGDNSVPALATLILMPYTKVLRNITNSFSINYVSCGEYTRHVWGIDGNIRYLSSKHSVLFAVATVFLLIGAVYTGLLLTFQWLQRYSGKCCKGTRDPIVRLKPLLDVYTGPYKDKYRFWTGLRLIVHLCLTVLFALTSGTYSYVNNYIICVTVFFLTSITISQRNLRLRYREMLSYINLFLLAVLSAMFSFNQSALPMDSNMITIISVSVEVLLFTTTVGVNIYNICKKRWPGMCRTCDKCNMKLRVPRLRQHQHQPLVPVNADQAQSPDDHVVNERESMIFEMYLD